MSKHTFPEKLAAHVDGDEDNAGRIEVEGFGVTHHVQGADMGAMLPELVRRYNVHDELLEALKLAEKLIAANWTGGTLEAIQAAIAKATPNT